MIIKQKSKTTSKIQKVVVIKRCYEDIPSKKSCILLILQMKVFLLNLFKIEKRKKKKEKEKGKKKRKMKK